MSMYRSAKTLLTFGLFVFQTTFGQLVVHDFVEVGNPGNLANYNGFGAVGYAYKIGKFEVTVNQYSTYLNAVARSDPYGVYNSMMYSDMNVRGIFRQGSNGAYSYSEVSGTGNKPVAYIGWYDAARYCNWLHNGATVGASTETGAYTLNGATSGSVVSKNSDARFWIPTDDEWYKAAYYSPVKNGVGGYYMYPTQSDALPGNLLGSDLNQANIFQNGYAVTGSTTYRTWQNYLTDAGTFSNSASYYGTFDQAGNIWEWIDVNLSGYSGVRGGSFSSQGTGSDYDLSSSSPSYSGAGPADGNGYFGFRVASVPEPSSLSLLLASGAVLMAGRRRG